MAVTQLNDGRWIVYGRPGYFPEDPDRRREYFGRGSAGEHDARDRDAYIQTMRRRARLQSAASPLLVDLFQAYVEDLQRRGHPDTTVESLIYKATAHILPALGHLPAATLTADDLNRYIDHRRAQPITVRTSTGPKVCATADGSPRYPKMTTISDDITYILRVLTWAAQNRYLESNPVAAYRKPRRDNARLRPPDLAEIRAILEHAPGHLRRALLLEYHTGARPGAELFGIRWDDVDHTGGTIYIRSAKKGGLEFRRIPVPESLLGELKRWQADDDTERARRAEAGKPAERCEMIINWRGKPVKTVKRSFAAAKAGAEITRRITLYGFRHAFATALLEGAADLKSTSELLGHSRTDTTTAVYQHTSQALHRAAVEKLPGLLGNTK